MEYKQTGKKQSNMNLKIAILDMNDGKPNQGMRCIKSIVSSFLENAEYNGDYTVFDVRQKNEIPNYKNFDIFISSGGPGSPYPTGAQWEHRYNQFLDDIWLHNQNKEDKKFMFLICHSFQLACYHWELGNVCPRRSTSFGIMPVHKTLEGILDPFFEGLPNPFFAVDSRDFQVIEPNDSRLEEMGAEIVALEKIRPHVDLERAVMAIRYSEEIFGTQFHPEADADGMRFHFALPDKREAIVKRYGEKKYEQILEHLDDDEKIMLTEKVILPTFLQTSAKSLSKQMITT